MEFANNQSLIYQSPICNRAIKSNKTNVEKGRETNIFMWFGKLPMPTGGGARINPLKMKCGTMIGSSKSLQAFSRLPIVDAKLSLAQYK